MFWIFFDGLDLTGEILHWCTLNTKRWREIVVKELCFVPVAEFKMLGEQMPRYAEAFLAACGSPACLSFVSINFMTVVDQCKGPRSSLSICLVCLSWQCGSAWHRLLKWTISFTFLDISKKQHVTFALDGREPFLCFLYHQNTWMRIWHLCCEHIELDLTSKVLENFDVSW